MLDAQKRLQNAPAGAKDLEDLLPKVDRIAEIIKAGSPERKKELVNTLFMRIEERDGHITAVFPHDWARPFFNEN